MISQNVSGTQYVRWMCINRNEKAEFVCKKHSNLIGNSIVQVKEEEEVFLFQKLRKFPVKTVVNQCISFKETDDFKIATG